MASWRQAGYEHRADRAGHLSRHAVGNLPQGRFVPLRPSAREFITQSDHGFQREKNPPYGRILSRFFLDELAGGDIRHAGIGEFARLDVVAVMDDPDPQPLHGAAAGGEAQQRVKRLA